jgi:hypothetical protein
MTQLEELITRYVAIWNEPDPDRRRASIPLLWTDDGANFTSSIEARGYGDLEARITKAHDQYVATGEYRFRSASNGQGHHNTAKFSWEMVRTDNGEVGAAGTEFFLLADDGRIDADYQFLES